MKNWFQVIRKSYPNSHLCITWSILLLGWMQCKLASNRKFLKDIFELCWLMYVKEKFRMRIGNSFTEKWHSNFCNHILEVNTQTTELWKLCSLLQLCFNTCVFENISDGGLKNWFWFWKNPVIIRRCTNAPTTGSFFSIIYLKSYNQKRIAARIEWSLQRSTFMHLHHLYIQFFKLETFSLPMIWFYVLMKESFHSMDDTSWWHKLLYYTIIFCSMKG